MICESIPPSSLLARVAIGLVGCALGTAAMAATPNIKTVGTVSHLTIPDAALRKADSNDYVNARALPMPNSQYISEEEVTQNLIGVLSAPATIQTKLPVVVPGRDGDGTLSPLFLGKPARAAADDGGVGTMEFGTSNTPFSTARADGYTGSTNQIYPFRAAGKVFFNIGSGTFICTASLIGKGLIVTAAHCVSEFGTNTFYSNFQYIPGYKNGAAPYGKWAAKDIFVINSYLNGSDQCSQRGVTCKNDVAVVVVAPQGTKLPGTATGWFGYGYDGTGFTGSGRTHITQLGYPACLDNGAIMERNDSEGVKTASYVNNTIIGTLMCQGSSGGPWIINFGKRPNLTDQSNGSGNLQNAVVGVTSWGPTDRGPKYSGASPFLKTNIETLVTAACKAYPANCAN